MKHKFVLGATFYFGKKIEVQGIAWILALPASFHETFSSLKSLHRLEDPEEHLDYTSGTMKKQTVILLKGHWKVHVPRVRELTTIDSSQ